jgi:hypothetical protein
MQKKSRKQEKQSDSNPEWHNFVPVEQRVSCVSQLHHAFTASWGVVTNQAGWVHIEKPGE